MAQLVPHPATLPGDVTGVEADFSIDAGQIMLTYSVAGDAPLLPERAAPKRADGLWSTTCFELFLKAEGADGYFEYNFSPSGEWAAYAFDGYRKGMRPLEVAAPVVERVPGDARVQLRVRLALPAKLSGACRMGLSAVIEEASGVKSYWAVAHPPGKPDFHADAGFAVAVEL